MTNESKTLVLEVIENGTHNSLVDDTGRIWATGKSSRSMLRDAAWPAGREGYQSIMIGTQTWGIEACKDI